MGIQCELCFVSKLTLMELTMDYDGFSRERRGERKMEASDAEKGMY